MKITALKAAKHIEDVLKELKQSKAKDIKLITEHIRTRYYLEGEANDWQRALCWAKQRVVSACGGTYKQWQAFSTSTLSK